MLPLFHISQLILFGSNDSCWLVFGDLRMWKEALSNQRDVLKRADIISSMGYFSPWATVPVHRSIFHTIIKETKLAPKATKLLMFSVLLRERRGQWIPLGRRAGNTIVVVFKNHLYIIKGDLWSVNLLLFQKLTFNIDSFKLFHNENAGYGTYYVGRSFHTPVISCVLLRD